MFSRLGIRQQRVAQFLKFSADNAERSIIITEKIHESMLKSFEAKFTKHNAWKKIVH